MSERVYMERAYDLAKKQADRYGTGDGELKPDPLVGCVIVTKDGKLYEGYRGGNGEDKRSEHAEYTVLEKMTEDERAGATVYTTLEPCTERRPNITPCADHLVAAKVSRVVIGIMDQDDRGRGYQKLFDAGIKLGLFEPDVAQKIADLNRPFIESRKQSSACRPWFSEIENACGQRVKILADLAGPPAMKSLGEYHLPPELSDTYETNRHKYKAWNEGIAEFKRLTPDLRFIEYQHYDYAQWMTLRNAGRKPRSIYSGAILVCPDTASIYVHERAQDVALEPGKLHGFFGGFIVKHQNISDETLLNACHRELQEESAAQPALEHSRVVIVENLEIGTVDAVFMAGVLSKENVFRLKDSPEGKVVPIPFDKIGESICENPNSWVISGIAHHLIWLKLGAPGAPSWFADEGAQKTYNRILTRISP